VGHGTCFRLKIPMRIVGEEITNAEEPQQPEIIGLQPGQPEWRLLVVDDNRENLLMLTDLLVQAGFSPQEAENGAQAIAIFQAWRPHFIWMDVRMPGLDGYETTKKIRALPGGDQVKIVVLKPFRDQEIFDMIARELGAEYIYREQPVIPTQQSGVEFSAEMLADLPQELLQELNRTTLIADREATLAVIERIEEFAPEIAASLRAMVENFQMGRLRGFIKKTEIKDDS
jgi:CheY-like chemotaxis protein